MAFLCDKLWENSIVLLKRDIKHRSVPSVFHKIYIVYIVVWDQTRDFVQTTLCLLTILEAAKSRNKYF